MLPEPLGHGVGAPVREAEVGEAIDLAQDFAALVRQRQPMQLDPWLKRATMSPLEAVRRFATGLYEDYKAVKAGVTLGCPNRPLALDQFLDSPCQSRLSHAWWRSSFKEKGVIQACQLRPIGICTTG
jgi:hypothetical protein